MKKFIFILFLAASCQTAEIQNVPEKKCPACPEPNISKVIVKDSSDQTRDLVLTKEEFLSIYRMSEKYAAIQDLLKDKKEIQKNIISKRIDEKTFEMTIKLNNDMSLTFVLEVENEEFTRLKEKMKSLTTKEPNVDIRELGEDKFEITMSIEDVRWTAVINASKEFRFSKYCKYGLYAGMVIGFFTYGIGAAIFRSLFFFL